MSRFLFTALFSNDLGLPSRTLPIALELVKRGHEVAFCNPEEAPRRLIAEAGVAVLAGTDFGSGGEGYIRLVYAVSMDAIEEGLENIATWFRSL